MPAGRTRAASRSIRSCAGFRRSRGTVEDRLRYCLDAATAAIRDRETLDRRLSGMGTTVVAALYDGRGVDWLSVGDSPMWLFAGGALARLNEDHSMAPLVEELVRTGELSPHEARNDWRRHMLRSAVMSKRPELVDRAWRPCRLLPGEFLLVASDGIETLAEEEIARTPPRGERKRGGSGRRADVRRPRRRRSAPGQRDFPAALRIGALKPRLRAACWPQRRTETGAMRWVPITGSRTSRARRSRSAR